MDSAWKCIGSALPSLHLPKVEKGTRMCLFKNRPAIRFHLESLGFLRSHAQILLHILHGWCICLEMMMCDQYPNMQKLNLSKSSRKHIHTLFSVSWSSTTPCWKISILEPLLHIPILVQPVSFGIIVASNSSDISSSGAFVHGEVSTTLDQIPRRRSCFLLVYWKQR